MLNGPAGRLECRYHHSKNPNAPLALILHSDPERGGTMNNRVTYMMFQAMKQRGFSVMRFNFRGVGKSQGLFDKGEGELSDAATVLDWMQELNKNAPYVWVGGFSFGAWIGMQLLMRRPEIEGFISVAPPTHQYDFGFLAPCPSSGLVIHGEKDNIISEEGTNKMLERLAEQKGIEIDYRVVTAANHFFHDKTDDLVMHIHDHMNAAEFSGLDVPVAMKKAA